MVVKVGVMAVTGYAGRVTGLSMSGVGSRI